MEVRVKDSVTGRGFTFFQFFQKNNATLWQEKKVQENFQFKTEKLKVILILKTSFFLKLIIDDFAHIIGMLIHCSMATDFDL